MVSRTNPTFSPEHIRFLNYIKAIRIDQKRNHHLTTKKEMRLKVMKELMNNPYKNLVKIIQLNAVFLGFSARQFKNIEKGYTCLQD